MKNYIIVILLLIGLNANAQISVRIDSLSHSSKIKESEFEWFNDFPLGPCIHTYLTLENFSGIDILAFTLNYNKDYDLKAGRCGVDLLLQLQYEYNGVQYLTRPANIIAESSYVLTNEELFFKGTKLRALVVHNGESIDGWDFYFFPFEHTAFSENLFRNNNPRVDVWNKLQDILEQILPTIKINAYPVEVVSEN